LLNNFPDLEIYTPSISNKNEELIIVCLANLRHPKDHFTLLQGMAIISKKHPQLKFKLWLVGRDYDDLYSKELKSFIESEFLQYYVFLLGSRNDVSDLLSQSHIGVLSSESEGLPVALLEYGLAGLPVVCTSVGECPEVLGHGKYGIVVPPKSPEQLAEALALLINEPAERKRLGTALQVQVQQHYSRDAIMKGLLELYHEVMSN
ncbi:MAG: glycosyltransferase, partial [Saprospiraceae bacterium]|nr:glycosyltransferase [Saprospiraceae bacterium]